MTQETTSSESLAPEVSLATLGEREAFWRDNRGWLEERGYRLRARYQPDWKASWLESGKDWWECEDACVGWTFLVDATRISDGSRVMFKKVQLSEYPEEVEIAQTLSSNQYTSDPKNHSVPIYEVLEVPGMTDTRILVMPLLYPHNYPRFKTIGEVIDYLRQIIEGLQFLHEHHIAHRDYKLNNTMAASFGLYSQPPHPFSKTYNYDFTGVPEQRSTRTETPIRYHVIDFGLSKKYGSKEGNLEAPPWGGYSGLVPEFKTRKPCDPFPVDIFYLGYLIRNHFVAGSEMEGPMRGMEFLNQLTLDMTTNDPKERPKIDEVREHFERLVKNLSWMKLRSPALYPKNQHWSLAQSVAHWKHQFRFILKGVPAIPQSLPIKK